MARELRWDRYHAGVPVEPYEIRDSLTMAALEVAVPMWQDRWMFRFPEERLARVRELADLVGETTGGLIEPTKDTRPAHGFNAAAEGIAIASFALGGVNFAGRHWDANDLLAAIRSGLPKPAEEGPDV